MDFNPLRLDNLSLLTQEELKEFIQDVMNWIEEDEELGNPFSRSIMRTFKDTKISIKFPHSDSDPKDSLLLYFHPKESPHYCHETCNLIERYNDGSIYVNYRTSDSRNVISYEEWANHPSVQALFKIRKAELKKKISSL